MRKNMQHVKLSEFQHHVPVIVPNYYKIIRVDEFLNETSVIFAIPVCLLSLHIYPFLSMQLYYNVHKILCFIASNANCSFVLLFN